MVSQVKMKRRVKLVRTEYIIERTLQGLLITAREKVSVLGEADAEEDVKRLREVYEDLVLFWGLDEDKIEAFDK